MIAVSHSNLLPTSRIRDPGDCAGPYTFRSFYRHSTSNRINKQVYTAFAELFGHTLSFPSHSPRTVPMSVYCSPIFGPEFTLSVSHCHRILLQERVRIRRRFRVSYCRQGALDDKGHRGPNSAPPCSGKMMIKIIQELVSGHKRVVRSNCPLVSLFSTFADRVRRTGGCL